MGWVRRNAVTWSTHTLLTIAVLAGLYHADRTGFALVIACTLLLILNLLLFRLSRAFAQSGVSVDEIPQRATQEHDYAATFDRTPVGILHLSPDGRVLLANPTATRMLEQTGGKVLTELSIDQVVLADDLPRLRSGMDALLSDHRAHFECDIRVARAGRPARWMRFVIANINSSPTDGRRGPLVATLSDIQAIKHYEQLQAASEKKFRTIAESLPAVVWMATPDFTRLFFVNAAYEQIWGRSCESLYVEPRSLFDCVHVDDRARVQQSLFENLECWHLKYRIVRPDGEIRFVRESGSLLRDDDNNPAYLVSTAIDISLEINLQNRMREVMNQLQNANEKLEQMVRIDALTQCYTRQVAIDEMDKELSRFRRYATPSTLVFIDMNHFKDINDTYGHTVGDDALRNAALAIRQQIRETDVLARYAGDEFVLLLKHTDIDDAHLVVDKLRVTPILVHTNSGSLITVTASFGVVALNADIRSVTHWIDCADKAMYDNKKQQD
jgi:diguanylate cyclase (GGDEF)-like protein/PAS domain S-box-containing protein